MRSAPCVARAAGRHARLRPRHPRSDLQDRAPVANALRPPSPAPLDSTQRSCSYAVLTMTRSMRAQIALALDDFRCELEIGVATDTLQVVDQHRLAVGRRFGDAHVAR